MAQLGWGAHQYSQSLEKAAVLDSVRSEPLSMTLESFQEGEQGRLGKASRSGQISKESFNKICGN